MPKKSKILFIAPFPPPFAGPENSAKTFIESPVNDKYEIIKYNTNFRKSNADKGKVGVKMIFAFFQLNYRLIKALVSHKPKIVYFYVTATMLGWIGKDIWVIIISKLFGSKVVIHMRAGHFRKNYDLASKLVKKLIKFTLNQTDFNLGQSYTLAEQYSSIVKDDNKIGFVYNMINVSKYKVSFDNYDPNIILFLGHLSFAKGYCDILKIIPEVSERFPNVKFCFAGTKKSVERNILFNNLTGESLVFEDPEQVYQDYVKGSYDNNYSYLGKLGEVEKIEWLKKCNLFVLPSYSEGFSTAVLEAIATGKPIITTQVGGLVDIIDNGENGFLIKPGEKEDLKNSILKLLSDSSLRSQMAKNNEILRGDFALENVSNEYVKLFDSLVRK